MKDSTFEQKLDQIDAILAVMDDTETPLSLEAALQNYQQGIRLIRESTALEEAQKKVDAADTQE
ncbi:MAG: exodeoxyribonuclease VII small subunit [Christensenellaceae bacterium]